MHEGNMHEADMVEGRCCRRNISVEYSERSGYSALHAGHWRTAYVCKIPGSAACVSFHVAATPPLNRRQSLSSIWAGPSRRYGLPHTTTQGTGETPRVETFSDHWVAVADRMAAPVTECSKRSTNRTVSGLSMLDVRGKTPH